MKLRIKPLLKKAEEAAIASAKKADDIVEEVLQTKAGGAGLPPVPPEPPITALVSPEPPPRLPALMDDTQNLPSIRAVNQQDEIIRDAIPIIEDTKQIAASLKDTSIPSNERLKRLKQGAAILAAAGAGAGLYNSLKSDVDLAQTAPIKSVENKAQIKSPEDQSFKNISAEEIKKPSKIAKPEEIKKADETPEKTDEPDADESSEIKNDLQQFLDFMSGKSESSVEELRKAQQERDNIVKANELQKSLAGLGSGIGAVVGKNYIAPDTSMSDSRLARAGQGIEDLKARLNLEDEDPQSSVSKGMQEFLKTRFGINTNASAAVIGKTLLPLLEKQQSRQDVLDQRREYAKQLAEEKKLQREQQKEEKQKDRELRKLQLDALKLEKEKQKEEKQQKYTADQSLKFTKQVQNPEYKKLNKLVTASDTLEKSVLDPNPQRDLGAIYDYIKILDPDSAVREGEIKFTGAARSIPTQVKATLNKWFKGNVLTETEKQNILEFAKDRLSSQKRVWLDSVKPIRNQAKKLNIPEEDFLPEEALGQTLPSKKEVRRKTKDGRIAIFDEQTKEFLRYEGQ